MPTALDLISSALRLINVVAAGEQTPIAMANDALQVLNDMIDSWNTDRLAIYTISTNDFPYVLNQQTYTLGTGGDFNIPRPARIEGMSTIQYTDSSNPVEIPIAMYSVDRWQNEVPVKNVQGSIPLICYDDDAFPLRNLNFWPIPVDQPNKVRIYAWQALPAQTLDVAVSFPPGYRQAFRYNLAALLAAEFAATVPQIVATIAVDSLAKIRSLNAPSLSLVSDLVPDPSGWNYKADLFGIGL
jgi:hypothetical protein